MSIVDTIKDYGYDYSLFQRFAIIAEGSYGTVKKAYYNSDKTQIFAIKEMTVINTQDEIVCENEIEILEELNKLKRKPLSFPNYYGYIKKKKGKIIKYKILLEYFPYSLENIIEQENFLSFKKLKSIVYQLIDGLAFLQSMGLTHRDLKPANILYNEIDEKITIKIIDFGISKQEVPSISQEMTLIGTINYFSPELLINYNFKKNNEINSYKSDVFSLGLIIMKLTTNYEKLIEFYKCKHEEDSLKSIKKQISKLLQEFKDNYEIEKKNREFFYEIIESMLEIESENRPDFIELCIKSINKNDLETNKLQNLIFFKEDSYEIKKNKKLLELNLIQPSNSEFKNLKDDNIIIKKSKMEQEINKKSLYLHNLLPIVSENDIINIIKEYISYGGIENIEIKPPKRLSKFNTNYCFINFTNEIDCSTVLKEAKNDYNFKKLFKDRNIFMDYSKGKKYKITSKKFDLKESPEETKFNINGSQSYQENYYVTQFNTLSDLVFKEARKTFRNNHFITTNLANQIVKNNPPEDLVEILQGIKIDSNLTLFKRIVKKELKENNENN